MVGDHIVRAPAPAGQVRILSIGKEALVLEQKMSQLLECLDAVRYKILFYQAAQKAGTISIHENIPAKVKEVRRRMMHPKR